MGVQRWEESRAEVRQRRESSEMVRLEGRDERRGEVR